MSGVARRLFFALWPDEPARGQLLSIASAYLAGWRGRPLAACDLHVTLCFLGAVPQARVQLLCEQAGALAAAPVELLFDRLQYWRASRALVLTGAEVPAAAQALASALMQIGRSCGLMLVAHPLQPHLTLMRSVQASREEATPPAAGPPVQPLVLRATRFYLAQSHELGATTLAAAEASRYQLIAEWPLRA